ncbi:MAG: cysteine hydrolase [Ideonella sp. MAG2]|nr:MAG: cysteine hydrolase [Ideonella sp. MAG2]
MTSSIQLLIIDPQNDFCDLPPDWWPRDPHTSQPMAPALPVAGAHQDMQRLAGFMRQAQRALLSVTITLDSHHVFDIAHPAFWWSRGEQPVAPFTSITAAQVRAGEYSPRSAAARPKVLSYLDTLEATGRYQLMVWPTHCVTGTWGHNLHADIAQAAQAWEQHQQQAVRYLFKGLNPWTEHYSAFQAEVPDLTDPDTGLQEAALAHLDTAELLLVAGQASSHCVRASVEHLVAHLPSGRPQRIVLLTDCMSPVTGFEPAAQTFFDTMQAQGVRLATSTQALDRLF